MEIATRSHGDRAEAARYHEGASSSSELGLLASISNEWQSARATQEHSVAQSQNQILLLETGLQGRFPVREGARGGNTAWLRGCLPSLAMTEGPTAFNLQKKDGPVILGFHGDLNTQLTSEMSLFCAIGRGLCDEISWGVEWRGQFWEYWMDVG